MGTRTLIPTEEEEQVAFVQWCRIKGYVVHHCANEVGGGSMQLKMRAIKAKKMGTSKGFPDLLIFVPIYGVIGEPDAYQPIAIEMKRKKGGVISPEQKQWGEVMSAAGIPFKVCKGCEEAIEFVKEVVDYGED